MIFYFSGTGNSQWVAEELAHKLSDRATPIMAAKSDYTPSAGEKIGFVFPIYAWDAPTCMYKFIEQLNVQTNNYIYMVATCHSQAGGVDKVFKKALAKKGLTLNAAFSINMPNNYLLAPFVKTDSESKRNQLLSKAQNRLKEISAAVEAEKNVVSIKRGLSILSKIAPLFRRFMNDKAFYVEKANCIQCGVCAKVCPMKNITLTPFPEWNGNCAMCQACLHHCPKHAIQYGHFTKGKKRYFFKKEYLPHD